MIHRYPVKKLLQLDFFSEDTGVKVDIVNRDEEVEGTASTIQLRLRVMDSKKRSKQHKENEAIQFDYNIAQDNPEEVAQEMVSGFVWFVGWEMAGYGMCRVVIENSWGLYDCMIIMCGRSEDILSVSL